MYLIGVMVTCKTNCTLLALSTCTASLCYVSHRRPARRDNPKRYDRFLTSLDYRVTNPIHKDLTPCSVFGANDVIAEYAFRALQHDDLALRCMSCLGFKLLNVVFPMLIHFTNASDACHCAVYDTVHACD